MTKYLMIYVCTRGFEMGWHSGSILAKKICLFQFRFRQYIPPPPPDCNTLDVDIKCIGYHSSVLGVVRPIGMARTPHDVNVKYLE